MKFTLIHTVSAEIEITREQLDLLLTLSRNHYDYACRAASRRVGDAPSIPNGLLVIMANIMEDQHSTRYSFSAREIDLMLKILEPAAPLLPTPESVALRQKLLYVLHRLTDEWHSTRTRAVELEVPSVGG